MELADTLHNVTVQTPDATSVLADALTKAVVALGRAGEPEQASRIAARAYADIRAAARAADDPHFKRIQPKENPMS